MKKFLIKGSIWFMGFIILASIIAFSGKLALRKSSFFKSAYLINKINTNDTLSYFTVGSSRGLTSLNTKIIDEQLNTKGLNLSMYDTDLKTNLLMVRHFYNSGFSSNYCVLVLDAYSFDSSNNKLGDNDYKFIPFSEREYIHQHYASYEKTFLKPLTSSKYFPFIAFSYYNLQLIPTSIIAALKPNHRYRFDNRGNYSYPNTYNNKTIKYRHKTLSLNNPIIQEIKQLVEENNSELIIYLAPYKDLIIDSNADSSVINHSNLIKDPTLFYDDLHLNKNGTDTTSMAFAEELKKLIQ